MLTIIACTMRSTHMNQVFNNFDRQNWKNKEMVIVLNKDDMNIAKWRERADKYPKNKVRVYKVPEKYTLGKCLNFGISRAKNGIITKFDDDDYYGRNYLRESVIAFRKRKGTIVGKTTAFLYFEEKKALMVFREGSENKRNRSVKGGTLLFSKDLWRRVKFPENRQVGTDSEWIIRCRRRGFTVYSVSKKNYVCIRRKNIGSHTQKKSTSNYMAHCKLVTRTNNFIPYIS